MKLEIGQRIDIYKVLDSSSQPNGFKNGTLRPHVGIDGNNIVGLLSQSGIDLSMVHTPFNSYKKECKKVGKMVIKSLK